MDEVERLKGVIQELENEIAVKEEEKRLLKLNTVELKRQIAVKSPSNLKRFMMTKFETGKYEVHVKS